MVGRLSENKTRYFEIGIPLTPFSDPERLSRIPIARGYATYPFATFDTACGYKASSLVPTHGREFMEDLSSFVISFRSYGRTSQRFFPGL